MHRRPWVHAVGLLIVLLALVPLIDNGYLAIPDEGVYTAQADNLARGAWAQNRPTADIDRNGDWFIVTGSVIVGDQAIPYARRPLYPVMLTPFFGSLGVGGGLVLSAIGTWVAACAAAAIAAELDRRATLPTLWLVGVGTPLLFDAFLLVGHSWGTAFVGLCALGVAKVLRAGPRRHQATWAALAFLAAGLATLARSEGVIAVLGLSAALAAVGVLGFQQSTQDRLRQAGLGIALAATAAAAYLLNDVWAKSITSGAKGDPTVAERMPDFMGALWSGILRPWYPDNTAANATMALVLLSTISAPLILRWLPRFRLLGLGLLALAAVAAAMRSITAPDLISGFIPTAPWLVIGLLSLRRRDVAGPLPSVLAVSSAAAIIAILATSYGFGGAAEWGGRFFHVLIPLVAPLGVLGLFEVRKAATRREWIATAASIALLTASLSVIALRSNSAMRADSRGFARQVEEIRSDHRSDPTVFATNSGDGSPRMFWQLSSTDRPLLSTDGLVNLPLMLDTLPPEVERIQVLTDIPTTKLLQRVVSNARLSSWIVRQTGDRNTYPYVYGLERRPS